MLLGSSGTYAWYRLQYHSTRVFTLASLRRKWLINLKKPDWTVFKIHKGKNKMASTKKTSSKYFLPNSKNNNLSSYNKRWWGLVNWSQHHSINVYVFTVSFWFNWEDISNTVKTVFHPISKHLEFRQKYSATRCIFNSLLGVWKCLIY